MHTLIDQNAEINVLCANNRSLVQIAVEHSLIEPAKILLDTRAHLNATQQWFAAEIIKATRSANLDMLRVLPMLELILMLRISREKARSQ